MGHNEGHPKKDTIKAYAEDLPDISAGHPTAACNLFASLSVTLVVYGGAPSRTGQKWSRTQLKKLTLSSLTSLQDTSSDLQLFAILSVTLVVFGGVLKGSLIQFLDKCLPLNDPSTQDAWWRNFYQVM